MTETKKIEQEIVARMKAAALPEALCARFLRQHRALAAGETGKVPWAEIDPPHDGDIIDLADTRAGTRDGESYAARGDSLLAELVVIKLNGGLGTTMQLDGPKSLIPVREGYTFLELVARQVELLRERCGAPVPLVLMDSYHTRDRSLALLRRIGFEQGSDIPLDFLQHKVPRIVRSTLRPLELGGDHQDDHRDWAPPGHGDIYLSLLTSGVLDTLVAAGYRWAFVSNVDNLAATVDTALLGYLDAEGIDFAMEVTDKTVADRKGGTLARRGDRLTLLERAQVQDERLGDFENIDVLSVFNTNSLWWRIDAVVERLHADDGFDLPLIVNPKRVAETDVVQLEVAMGAAVGSFVGAKGVRVPRSRFAPVKASSDLVAVASDAYIVDELGGLRPNPARERAGKGVPLVELDSKYYNGIDDLSDRIAMAPSLVACDHLRVEGDVTFSPGVVIVGDVTVRAVCGPVRIEAGTRLENGVFELMTDTPSATSVELPRMQPLQALPRAAAAGVTSIFTDIDDTLTDGGQLTAVAFDAMWRAHDAGVRVVAVTGRPAGWCDHLARMWPVAAVVGENGALCYAMIDGAMVRLYAARPPDAAARLAAIERDVLAEVPGCKVAADQPFRLYDLAIDFCEEVPRLDDVAVRSIAAVFFRHGATAKVSSIHVNGWFGSFDKLSMCRRVARELLAMELDARCVYVGDSPNDEPMFAAFDHGIGVANVRDLVEHFETLPRFVTNARGGRGFAEVVDTLLSARAAG